MKKTILLLSMVFVVTCHVFAQNAHWSYGLSSGTSASSAATVVIPVVNLITSHHNECPDAIVCAKVSESNDGEETKNGVKQKVGQVQIEEYLGAFICHRFNGVVEYEIIDVTGRTISKGKTVNERSNPININRYGLYLLRCTDEAGGGTRKISRK